MNRETSSPETHEAAPSPVDVPGESALRTLEDGSGQQFYVYRPADLAPDSPVLVVVHDISRDAESQVEVFAALCDLYGVMLVAPLFAADEFPNYQRLGRSRVGQKRGRRADTVLDSIVSEAAAWGKLKPRRVHLFGYAAGARFAMRYAMAHPDQVAAGVFANAGAYTFPDPDQRFPRGLDLSSVSGELILDPEHFLRVPMTLLEPAVEEDSASGRPLREVERSSGPGARSARAWIAAMREAAAERRLESHVALSESGKAVPTFQAALEQEPLAERVFEICFGPPPHESDLVVREEPEEDELQAGAQERARLKRIVLIVVGGLALLALLAPLLLWAQYRSTHIVSRDAVVRGHIADVGARLDGVVRTVEVDAGDLVTAGQVIARLEARHIEARVRQAKSELEKATRELEVERLAIANERLRLESALREMSAGSSVAAAELRAARSRAAQAKGHLEIQRSLAKQGLVREELIRAAETEYRTADAMVAASRAEQRAANASQQLATVESDGLAVREKRISVLEAHIAAGEAELAVAEADLEGTIIRAPDDGAVVRRIVEPGGATVVGKPIVSIWVGKETWVEAWVDESDLGDLEVGGEAKVTFSSHPDREFAGIVETISVSTDFELPDSEVPQPRRERMRDAPVVAVRIRMLDSGQDLFPGLSAVVGIRKKGH